MGIVWKWNSHTHATTACTGLWSCLKNYPRKLYAKQDNFIVKLSTCKIACLLLICTRCRLGEWNFSLGFHFNLQCTRRCWRQTFFLSLLFIVIIIIISGSGYYVDIFPRKSEWGKVPNVGIASGSIIVYASKCCARSCFVLRNKAGWLRRESTRCCHTLHTDANHPLLYAFTHYCHHSFHERISRK